jgi:hypothetical protein
MVSHGMQKEVEKDKHMLCLIIFYFTNVTLDKHLPENYASVNRKQWQF